MAKGERIKELREKMGYNQTELAELVKISKQTLYKYENNIVTNIPSDVLERIASVLNCSPGYFLGWEEYTPPENTPTFSVPWTEHGAKHNVIVTPEEIKLLNAFRKAPEEDQKAALRLLSYAIMLKGGKI